ncbi:hypothetical protein CC86DRAFT_378513 [Ophiobolus disseminans]|uniref:Uncharacterized protein n=1 Tax=Ophiobolus disseminans TaxID=1469910 RepID=A0A6A7AGC8_9PLEO|nr:hypothetical protein CC86DRAFT_378513 [Ophiobolus disseminans]
MVAAALLANVLVGFLSQTATVSTGPFNKIGFDMDRIGRARQIAYIEETARSTYEQAGKQVNIAVWNMHIPEKHHFNNILDTGLQPMGAGGGFRVVVFTGDGWIRIGGEGGETNWRVGGNVVVRGKDARFGSLKSKNDGWKQEL